MTTNVPTRPSSVGSGDLKRELGVADAAAFSVGLIGPVGVMALLGSGVAGILGVCPYYSRPSQAGIETHFRAIAGSTDLPVVLYDIPTAFR